MDWSVSSHFRKIFTAIKSKNTEEIRILLDELGGYVNYKSPDGRTPLHEAAKLGDTEILKLFVEHKNVIDVNIKDNDGSTALHYVIESSKNLEDNCKILIKAGADILVANNNGKTSLHILTEKQVDSKPFKFLEVLLKSGLDVNAQDLKKNTLLHHLTKKACDVEVIEMFLKAKAEVNIKNDEGQIPLFNAVGTGNLEAVRLLIDHGSDVNSVSRYSYSVLHKAAGRYNKNSQFQIVELLLKAGADVHVKDRYKQTPMYDAVQLGNDEIVQLLLDHGSDINYVDIRRSTFLQEATFFTKKNHNLSTVELLLKNGVKLNTQGKYGSTPLHNLVQKRNNEKTIKILLNYKPDVNIKDNSGKTPLHYAVMKNYDVNILQLLVDHGADVNCTGNYKTTPLHHVAYDHKTSYEIFKWLLKNGADANALDYKGNTALLRWLQLSSYYYNDASCEGDFKKTLQFLLKFSDINVIDQTKQELLSLIEVEEIWKIVLKHLAKLQTFELPLNPAFENSISSRPEFIDYFAKCLEELNVAKRTKLQNCWVTYFNLLTDDKKKLKNYAGNADLIEAFEKSDYVKTYPIHGSDMQENLEKGKKKRRLFDDSADILSNYCPIFGPTHLIIREILDYFATKDLSKFCE